MPVKVGVVGLGNWGIALGEHLAKKGCSVIGWTRDQECANIVNVSGHHPKYLPQYRISFKASADLSDVLVADYVLLTLPSAAIAEYAQRIATETKGIIVSAIKGFDRETGLTPLELLKHYNPSLNAPCILSGPSFALDVIRAMPCGVVVGCSSLTNADMVCDLFSNETMRAYSSVDPIGVELGGAVKNVITIASGVSDGMGLGDSARAGLITRGLAEMIRLGDSMGARQETFSGLSGLGDLAMSASSPTSRNYRVGFDLGKGKKLTDILINLRSVAEGVSSTPIVLSIAQKKNVDMPISHAVSNLISGKFTTQEMVKSLMMRPRKQEFPS